MRGSHVTNSKIYTFTLTRLMVTKLGRVLNSGGGSARKHLIRH